MLAAVGQRMIRRLRRPLGWAARRLVPEAEPSAVLPFVQRWGAARARALLRRRGLVRGTVLVCPQPGRVWVIGRDIPLPGPGEVLVRAEASAISPGTERAFFTRLPNAVPTYPYYPGYSLAGEVAAAGRGSRYRPGDRVALAAPHGSVALAPDARVFPVPPGVPFEEAAFVQLGIIALQAVGKARVEPGSPVVVLGMGLIGQLLLHLCAAAGAYPVVAVSRTARRTAAVLRQVAQHVVIVERDSWEALGTLESPVTFDATGSPDGFPAAVQCTGVSGQVILVGSTRGVTEQADFGLLADRGISVVGAHINSLSIAAQATHAAAFLARLADRRINVSSLISERIHPMEAEWFYRRLAGRDDATVGAVLRWDYLSSAERLRRVYLLTPPDLEPFRRGRLALAPLSVGRPSWAEGVHQWP